MYPLLCIEADYPGLKISPILTDDQCLWLGVIPDYYHAMLPVDKTEEMFMTKRKLFALLAVVFVAGAIIQQVIWKGGFSVGLIVLAALCAWCSWKAKD